MEAQSELASKTFKELGICIIDYLNGNENLHTSLQKIRNNEKEANKLRRKNLDIVAQAVNIYRNDLFRVVMKLSSVMSNQIGASVRLGKIRYVPRPDDQMIPKFKNSITVLIEMGDELRNLMVSLSENLIQAKDKCYKIDEIEEKVDEIYRDLHGFLYNREDILLRVIMQLLSVAKHIEEACDHASSVADSVRIILDTH